MSDVKNLKPGWKIWRFDQIAKQITDRAEPTPEDSELYIGLEHMDPGSLKIRRWGSQTDLIGTKFRMRKGEILFARRNAYLKRVAIAPHDGLFSAHGMVLRPKSDAVLPDFLPFFMQSDLFMDRAIEISVGSLSPTINWKTMAVQEFALPPMEEQRRMIKLFRQFDDALESYRGLKTAVATVDTALIRHFFSPSIASPVVERHAETLGNVCEIRTGKLDSNAATENGDYPFFTCSPETLRINRFSFDCDAVLLAGNNAQGNFSVRRFKGKFDAYQRTYVITPNADAGLLTGYLELTLRRALQLLKQYSVGSTTKYLTLDVIKKIEIPLVPIGEQLAVIDAAEAIAAAYADSNRRSMRLQDQKRLQLNSCLL